MNTNASGDLKAAKKDLNDLTQKELKLLEEQIKLEERLSDLQSKKDAASKKQIKLVKEELAVIKEKVSKTDDLVKAAQELVKEKKKELAITNSMGKELASLVHHYHEMPQEIQKQIAGVKKMSNLFNEVLATVAEQKATMKLGNAEDKRAAAEKLELFESLAHEIEHSAEHAADAQRELNQMLLSELDKRALIIKANTELGDDEKKRAIAALHYADLLNKKAEALHEVQHASGHIFHSIDDDLQSSVKGYVKFCEVLQ
jgi:chromosome segregation ATPase